MNVFLTYKKIDTGYSQNDNEQNDCRGRGKGRISATVTVEHIVNVAYYGIHLCGVKVSAEEGDCIAVCLEGSDKAGNYEIENGRRDGGESDVGQLI